MSPATGEILADRYLLTERIAGGGMGEVWAATDQVLGREVAVKILRREYADDDVFLERFRAEARHTAGLGHSGIAAVYDYRDGAAGPDGETSSPFLVMERIPGEPLSAIIARDGALSAERTLDVVAQAAAALQAAHDAGVIHRDVKPGNILVTPDGTVKITDFGIARAANAVPLTKTGSIMGTAFYISPEQASGQSVTPASDIYSLGVVAYECLSGRKPFAGDTPVSVALAQVREDPPAMVSDVPPEVAALVMRMLAKDPAARPSSAGELAAEALALRPTAALAATRTMSSQGTTATQPVVGGAPPAGAAAGGAAAGAAAVAAEAPSGPDGGPDTGEMSRSGFGGWLGTDTDPGFRLPAPGRTPHWVPYLVVLVLAAVALLLLLRACTGAATSSGNSAATTSPTSSASDRAEAVRVRAADYVGRPLSQARADLRAKGFTVLTQPVSAEKGQRVGTVTGVDPTGRLSPDTTVTLQYAAAGPKGKGGDHGQGNNDKDKD